MYHILIVDEEEHLLWALERNLFPDRQDVEVHTAVSGEEGLEILQKESIDLLISDIKMPGDVDGFQLILRAKEMVPDARVMIITAFGTNRIQNFAERIGISHYIEKPFTVDELRSAIREILDEKEGFQGVLSDLELTDIIQMLCLAKRTALLHLKHRDHRGRIVFDGGEVVHAEFDGEVGPQAVYEMLDLRQGDIFMQSDFEPVERSVEMGWQDMLLEGVKRIDEKHLQEEKDRSLKRRSEAAEAAQSEVSEISKASEASEASEVSEAKDESRAAQEKEARRTRTPMGMGVPAMAGQEVSEHSESTLEEPSSGLGMLFSEAEIEEMAMASEAAVDEPNGISDGGLNGEQSEEELEEGSEELDEHSEGLDEASQDPEPRKEPPTVVVEASAFLNPSTSEREEKSQISSEEPRRTQQPGRKRHGTSPGMTAVTDSMNVTEESGELELFAAPALNGRHSLAEDSITLPEGTKASMEEFVRECPGLKATALVSVGESSQACFVSLTTEGDMEEGEMASRMGDLFLRAQRSVQALNGEDRLHQIQLILDGEYVLVGAIEDTPLIHLAIVNRDVSLGIALVLMRQLGRQISAAHLH